MSGEPTDPVLAAPPEGVELRLVADLHQLHIARAVATDFALGHNADIDLIADIKLAVDELCTSLTTNALENSPLICRFRSDDGRIVVHGRVRCPLRVAVNQDTIGWHALNALADELATWTETPPNRTDERWLHIEFTARREEVDAG